MNRVFTSLGVLLLLGLGAWLLPRVEPTRMHARAAEVERASTSERWPEIVRAVRRRAEQAAPAGERRGWREVFPDADTAISDWHESHPMEVTVAPYADLPLTFRQTRASRDGSIMTWTGRSDDVPGGSLVGVARPGGYDAILLIPGASQFFFHVREGVVRVEESVARGTDCGVGDLSWRVAAMEGSHVHYAEAGDATQRAEPGMTLEAGAAPANAEVLFLYNTHALTLAQTRSADPIGYMDGYSRAALETCNVALENSRVEAFRWRLLGLASAPSYPAVTTVGEEVRVLSPEGPLGDFVGRIRRAYGADQVLMWIGPGERKGAAYAGDVPQTAASLEYAVAALRLTAPVLILGHELAHNFGCHHDRGHAGSGGGDVAQPNGDGYWRYGLLWEDPASEGGTTSGTVMAYADWLVPYFSNPNITLQVTSAMQGRGGTTRDLGTKTIGFVESDPRAAYNVRVLGDNAGAIARLGAEEETAPQIWDAPRDQMLSASGQLQLTVSASGRNLTYQWLRNGTAIAGATEASFAKAFVASDAGSYAVIVTNSKGSVTSSAASVSAAVATPAPSTPSTPAGGGVTSGGGGGGGGSPSIVFVGLVVLLGALRCARASRAAQRVD